MLESADTENLEDGMHAFHGYSKTLILAATILAALILIPVSTVHTHPAQAQSTLGNPSPVSDNDLLAGFRHVEVASVSDAIEQITGKPLYMSHRIQPIFT